MEVLIRLGLVIVIILASYLISKILRFKKNYSLLFLIITIISLLLSFIWNGDYSSFLQTMGIASLFVALVHFARNKFKKV